MTIYDPEPDGYVPLFQEDLKREPFWMLVACSLVNHTSWAQASPAFDRLTQRCGWDVGELASMKREELAEILRPLGLQNRRAGTLVKMAAAWVEQSGASGRTEVGRLPGCGKYAMDSWSIFVEGDLDLEDVSDHRLNEYLERKRNGTRATDVDRQR